MRTALYERWKDWDLWSIVWELGFTLRIPWKISNGQSRVNGRIRWRFGYAKKCTLKNKWLKVFRISLLRLTLNNKDKLGEIHIVKLLLLSISAFQLWKRIIQSRSPLIAAELHAYSQPNDPSNHNNSKILITLIYNNPNKPTVNRCFCPSELRCRLMMRPPAPQPKQIQLAYEKKTKKNREEN
jgi:hypothetical protein